METIYYYEGISVQNRRSVNMDSLLLKERVIQGTRVCLAVVCDGVGSLEDGAYAAASAVQMLGNWFENLEENTQLGPQLYDYVRNINLAVLTKSDRKRMRTACTLSCLLLCDGQYYIVHVGDSRIYSSWDSGVQQLTQDQTRGGKLTSAIGYKKEINILYVEGYCREKQKFLLCSDGLYKRMQPELLAEAFEKANRWNLKKALWQLADYVIERGEGDNISAALLIYEKR